MKPLFAVLPALLLAPTALAAPKPAPGPNWNRGTPLTVTMTNQGFVPARLALRQGGQYILRIRNPSDRTHSFSAKEFFGLARVSPADQAWIPRNEVELKPGQSATLHLVAPTTPGAMYYFKSTRVADAATKFKGAITVR
ncbi:cupredoxin domain-containing protein [Sphingomonas sp. BIUV-7]|uniref:Cupredoxin domain-containing protein n=1 Tax=Sphingomonas natans TaxID=3063330 RepID=A0ABT8Y758_9SPHN|nr:cupredoxin domain-containing protein [Sphingomonas sp. BIUV-7]MDO6413743.1 cupredoxin domain-containing protein [Sphingomonas sp. BIUV-7]